MALCKHTRPACEHDSILIVWNEDGSLDEVWCGVCELDVTEELGAGIVMETLQEELGRYQLWPFASTPSTS